MDAEDRGAQTEPIAGPERADAATQCKPTVVLAHSIPTAAAYTMPTAWAIPVAGQTSPAATATATSRDQEVILAREASELAIRTAQAARPGSHKRKRNPATYTATSMMIASARDLAHLWA